MAWIVPESIIEASPSRMDGVTSLQEYQLRREAILFIDETSKTMKLPRVAAATANVFFHRFFAIQSFRKHRHFDVALACILLASKVEESPKKLHDVIKTGFMRWNQREIDMKHPDFEKIEQDILKYERILLQTLNFDLCVEHPFRFLIDTIKTLNRNGIIEDKKKKESAQRAVSFLNDSMQTNLCLRFEPQKIAIACVYLSSAYLDISIPAIKASIWRDKLTINEDELSMITNDILGVYEYCVESEEKYCALKNQLSLS